MAENIIKPNDLAEKALESAETFASPDQVDQDAAEKFGSLLSAEKPPVETKVLGEGVPAVEETQGTALTLGDKVLQGMQGLREHVEAGREKVVSKLEPGEPLTMRDMFHTQMAMTNLMVTEDYIGKIVSKSTQTFDTLLRNQ